MELKRLVKDLGNVQIIGNENVGISSLSLDSKNVSSGGLFFCIKGQKSNGADYVRSVERNGVVAIVTESKLDTNLTQVIVEDTRFAMSIIAREFYGRCDEKLKLIGVVGTNGKTTTSHLIGQVLGFNKINYGVIGTIGTIYSGKKLQPTLTTPDPIELNAILADMVATGVSVCVMEVSAHAIFYDKIAGLNFFAGVFTNFSQDHLDFFGNMDLYERTKLKFFTDYNCKFIVTNSDDDLGKKILDSCNNVITYGIENPSDNFALDIKETSSGIRYVLNLYDRIYDVKSKLIGKINVYNELACASVSALLGLTTEQIAKGLNKAERISGRTERVYAKGFSVFIDYAHTPDGLKKVLSALRPITKGRLVCLFGCGGNRDQSKREVMGKISATLADYTVITTDNPRYEDPMEIINQIEKGVLSVSKKYVAIEDRKDAIFYALNMMVDGDLLLIAGKGCEDYQEVLGIKKPYNDKDTVEEYFR